GLKTTSVIRPTGSRVDAFTTCRWSRRLASHVCPLFDGDVEKGCGACGSMDSMAFCLQVHDAVAAVAAVLAHTLFGRVNVLTQQSGGHQGVVGAGRSRGGWKQIACHGRPPSPRRHSHSTAAQGSSKSGRRAVCAEHIRPCLTDDSCVLHIATEVFFVAV